MSKKKFGLNTNGWSKEFRSVFGSLEGYLGAAGFSTREIAKTPSDLFSIIFYAYGVKTDLKEPFSERIRQAQRRISLIPPKIRNKDQTRCRNKISIYGIDAFALEALKFVDQVSPVDLSDQKVAKAPKRKIPQKKKPQSNPYASFYRTWEWRTLRMQVCKRKAPVVSAAGQQRVM